jgi:hypothetical protein
VLWIAAAFPFLSVSAEQLPSSGVSFERPAALFDALIDAGTAIEVAGQCSNPGNRHMVAPRLADIENRYFAAIRRASGVWGSTLFAAVDQRVFVAASHGCRGADAGQAMDNAEAAVVAVNQEFAQATAAMGRGAWAGSLMLCRETVQSAESGFERVIGQPMLLVTLRSGFAAVLSSLTARSINGPLDIRLDGEVISEPIVLERIDGGQLQITGPKLSVLDRLSKAVKGPC